MEVNQHMIVPYTNQPPEPDYADSLHPGYKFLPSDADLIVYYLKPKIATGTHPPCRLHEVYLYDHHPQELAERYRASENKWYFLTSRERKYPRGSRPKRTTKEFGTWKATQKYTIVYDDDNRQMVGYKTNLAFYDEKGHKTAWLMHEYTTDDPNLPFGSGENGNELNKYVLCKVYKKEHNRNREYNRADEIRNVRNRLEVQTGSVEPSLERANHGPNIIDQTRIMMQPVVVTLHGSNSMQPPLQDPYQVFRRVVQSGAAAPPPPPPPPNAYINDHTTVVLGPSPVISRDMISRPQLQNSYQDPVQSGSNQPSMVSQDGTHDHIHQPPGYDEIKFPLDLSEYITLDDLNPSGW